MWGAIAKRSVGIAFGDVGSAIAVWDFGSAIAVWDFGSAIAKRSVGIAFGYVGMWECDSEALRRNRVWRCWNAIAFGVWGCDSEALRRNRFLTSNCRLSIDMIS